MTAKQKANRERFKKVVAEAKKLRKKNPKLTQAQAVKQAWAISYGKAGKSKKVGDVIVTYPSKKDAEYKMLRGRKGEFRGNQRISAVKKAKPTKVKARKSKKTSEMHTDTKSHNVNIRVISGTQNDILNKYLKANQDIEKLEKVLLRNKETQQKPQYKTDFWKKHFIYQNKLVKKYISELKKHKAELKKLM